MTFSRRRWAVTAVVVALATLTVVRLSSAHASGACAEGLHTLELGGGRTALMRVGREDAPGRKALLLVLHDAGDSAGAGLAAFRGSWDVPGLVLVAPDARRENWSFERRRGADLVTIDRTLTQVFSRCAIDSRRVGIGGVASGATSSLSLGIRNGRLFHAIIALSPGSIATPMRVGRPRVFVAHGTRNAAAFAETRNVLVRTLRREGYAVTFRAFTGGHSVPAAVSRAAVRWFLH